MKTLAVALSVSLVLGAAPPPPRSSTATVAAAPLAPAEPAAVPELPFVEVSTITVTAPRARDGSEVRVLKTARAAGVGVGAAGAGMMAYVIVLDLAGPFGWAASLLFLGGMTAYLSHRRLKGYQDFPPSPAAEAPRASTGTAASPPAR